MTERRASRAGEVLDSCIDDINVGGRRDRVADRLLEDRHGGADADQARGHFADLALELVEALRAFFARALELGLGLLRGRARVLDRRLSLARRR